MMATVWKGTWAVYQDRGFAELYARLSGQILMDLDGLLVYVSRKPFLGFTTAYLYGPEASESFSAATRERLASFVRSKRIARLVVYTYSRLPSFGDHPSSGGTHVIDLDLGEQEILRQMEGRSRTAIKKGQKAGLLVRRVENERTLREWYAVYAATAEERGFGRLSYAQVRGVWGSAWGALFGAFKGESLVAGAFLLLGPYPVYLLGATNPAHRHLSPTNVLQWEIMRWAKGQGYSFYDLGGVRDDPNHGPSRFKVSLGGTFRRVYSYSIRGPQLKYAALRVAEAASHRLACRVLRRR